MPWYEVRKEKPELPGNHANLIEKKRLLWSFDKEVVKARSRPPLLIIIRQRALDIVYCGQPGGQEGMFSTLG